MRIHSAVLGSLLLLSVVGCDSTREQIASMIKPRSADDVATSVNTKIDQSKYSEAKAEAESFLNGKEDASGRLSWALAKACAQLNLPDLALHYTQRALAAGVVSAGQAMTETLMEPVRTDIRFVTLMTAGQTGRATASSVESSSSSTLRASSAVAASTLVNITNGEITARAGDVMVKLPD